MFSDKTVIIRNKDGSFTRIYPVNGKYGVSVNDNDIVILAASQTNAPFSKLATPTYDEVEKRPFTFKLNLKEKLQYVYNKCVWQLGDKDNFIKDNNKGKDY